MKARMGALLVHPPGKIRVNQSCGQFCYSIAQPCIQDRDGLRLHRANVRVLKGVRVHLLQHWVLDTATPRCGRGYRVAGWISNSHAHRRLTYLARPERFELPTPWFVGCIAFARK